MPVDYVDYADYTHHNKPPVEMTKEQFRWIHSEHSCVA
jgi:hypothetical protein